MSGSTHLEALLEALPEELATRLRSALLSTQLTAAHAHLRRFLGKMHFETLGTGIWRGKDITGEGIDIHMKAESIAFEDAQVQLHLEVALSFQVPSLRKPKVYKLGPVHESVSTPKLPRINISSLAEEVSASFALSCVKADEVTADVAPIEDVEAGMAFVEDAEIRDLVAAHADLSVGGVHIGRTTIKSAGLQQAQAPIAHVPRAGIDGGVCASNVVLQGATIVNGRATASGDDLDLGFEVQLPTMTIKTFPTMPTAIERLVTRLSIRIKPKVVVQIGKLKLEGMTLTTRVGSLRIGSLFVPLDVKGLRFEDLKMDGMVVEDVEVGPSKDQ